jgi:hypothetical protein
MPNREDANCFRHDHIIEVIPSLAQQQPAHVRYGRGAIESAEHRGACQKMESRGEFVQKQIRCGGPVLAPPGVNFVNLCLGLRCELQQQFHRFRRRSSNTSAAGREWPDSADCQESVRASWSAWRSSGDKSSPSSSATRSITVPSGSVVGSSSWSRPFFTRACSGLMRLILGQSVALDNGTFDLGPHPQIKTVRFAQCRPLAAQYYEREAAGNHRRTRRALAGLRGGRGAKLSGDGVEIVARGIELHRAGAAQRGDGVHW